jgi:hypothetical protein
MVASSEVVNRSRRRRPRDEEFLCDVSHTGDIKGTKQECGFAGHRREHCRIAAGRHVRIIEPTLGPMGRITCSADLSAELNALRSPSGRE